MYLKKFCIVLFALIAVNNLWAQHIILSGKVIDKSTRTPLAFAQVGLQGTAFSTFTDSSGAFVMKGIPAGTYTVNAALFSYIPSTEIVALNADKELLLALQHTVEKLNEVHLSYGNENSFGINHLMDVEGTAIYAGKKTEVINLKDINANKATNNSRQIYSKIPGLNIWESDGAGVQLGIGGRGLNPKRTSSFNTRQNGYDISADALGYPESYYAPPAEAVDRIEIIRGAGALQYGPQFGGFVNFKLKQGPKDKAFELVSRETAGTYGFFNTFNSIGGTKKKINYYAFYQHKSGKGWRGNSEFNVNAAYASLIYTPVKRVSLTFQYTFMDYLMHQPGGLTDKMFEENPRQSLRERNWFKVNWNLAAFLFDFQLTDKTKINSRFFGLVASRAAIGLLIAPNRADPLGNRSLEADKYRNFGNETRLLHNYLIGKNVSSFLVGVRYYNGFTDRRAGMGNDGTKGDKSDFSFVNANDMEYAQYTFPSQNKVIFSENVFQLSPALSITPGVRFENIQTKADGFYRNIKKDLAGNVIFNQKEEENKFSARSFLIFGLGLSYKKNEKAEVYANFSQNFRSINFNDMRSINPNIRVDPNLEDEKGFTTDLGLRGNIKHILNYDASIFLLNYNNRIGTVLRYDSTLFNVYRFRTNISQSLNYGFESFAELDIWRLIKRDKAKAQISIFSNCSLIDARYVNSKEKAYENKKVELVPNILLKTGLTVKKGRFSGTWQYSFVSSQYTDATNTIQSANAINGLIPAYYVMDLSLSYKYKCLTFYGTVNNLTNNMYFTRRSEAYPGPGIVPSDGIGVYLTVQVKI